MRLDRSSDRLPQETKRRARRAEPSIRDFQHDLAAFVAAATEHLVCRLCLIERQHRADPRLQRALRAIKENARQGFWNGSLPPIGYRIVEAGEQHGNRTKKTLEIDPIQAETVRLIFRARRTASRIVR